MAFKIESKLLDACALAILSRGDTYGYEITQEFKRAIMISESTLYPVLRRLQKENLCMTYDEPYQGRNRRYYSITDAGRKQLEEYRIQWQDHKAAIDILLGEARQQMAGSSDTASPDDDSADSSAAGSENSGADRDVSDGGERR